MRPVGLGDSVIGLCSRLSSWQQPHDKLTLSCFARHPKPSEKK